jgi:hypothetical protein
MNRLFLKRRNNMRSFFSACVLLFCFRANASDIKYPVSAIQDVLKKDANAVKRM